MKFDAKQIAALEAPLSLTSIKHRDQAGRKLAYIEGWRAIAEANRIFGFDGWHRETTLLQETNRDLVELDGSRGPYKQWRVGYIAKVRITVGTIVREGTGYGSGMAKPEALGDAVESAIKEAETDAMKRGFMTFGNPFGLALYDKEQSGVEHDTPAPAPKLAAAPSQPSPPDAYTKAKEWVTAAETAIATLKTREAMAKWMHLNIGALDKVREADRGLYDAINIKISQRNSFIEEMAAA